MKNSMFVAVLLALAILAASAAAQTRTMTVTIADGKVPCLLDETKLCFAYQTPGSTEWYPVSEAIRGFKFTAGVTQTISVRYTPKEQATAEPGSLDWVYQKTLKRVKSGGKTGIEAMSQFERRRPPVLAGRNWTLTAMDSKPVEIQDIVLRFDRNSNRFGIRICNQMGGNFEQSGFDLKLNSLVSTRMACRDPQASIESRFQELMPAITRSKMADGKLALFAGDKKVLEFIEKVALEDARWAIAEVDGKRVVTSGDVPYLLLTKSGYGLTGFSGCNQIFGKYVRDGNGLRFLDVSMTKMACTEDDVIGIEIGVMDSLDKIDRYEIKNGMLILFAGEKARLKLYAMPN